MSLAFHQQPLDLSASRRTVLEYPIEIRQSDVLTVHNSDRFDLNSLWLEFRDENGKFLFSTSRDWYGYVPTDLVSWWAIDFKKVKKNKAIWAPEKREYVDLVRRTAYEKVKTLKVPVISSDTPVILVDKSVSGSSFFIYRKS